jgi:hypothetical protein
MLEALALRALEQRLFGLIRAPQGVEAGLAGRGLTAHDLDQFIAGDDRLAAIGRLGIYADMYFWRLLEVLRGAFPKLVLALGDDAFSALAAAYLDAHPSRHPSLRFLGERLPGFLRGDADLPFWAADLAALEWLRYDVFDDADAPVLTRAALARLAPEAFAGLPLRLQPAHRRLEASCPVEAVWRALGKNQTMAEPVRTATRLLVWRQDVAFVYHRRIDDLEHTALELAAQGCSFGGLCAAVAERVPGDDAAARAAFQLLGRWVDDGLLVDPT